MKSHFKENTSFYLISGDSYRDRASNNRPNFSETENFFNYNYNENVQENLLALGNRMDTYINGQNPNFRFRFETTDLAKNVSVAPFIERSIKYDVKLLDNEDIIFTSEKQLDENEMLTDYKFYIHSLPIFDRNFMKLSIQ